MSTAPLDQVFNLEDMIPKAKGNPPKFVRGTKKQKEYVIPGSSRQGRGFSYPWADPSYCVGDWFWKPVSPEDWYAGRGRPNQPSPRDVGGRKWSTSKAYREDTKQHGYYVERTA